jgi:alpha-tubulin suppressor-like RCC1 family protein
MPTVVQELSDHRVCQIAASDMHGAALTEDGALFTWRTLPLRGYDDDSPERMPELGYSFHDVVGTPYRVFGLEGVRITSVAVGLRFTVAVAEDGSVYSFGRRDAALGHGNTDGEDDVDREVDIDKEDVLLPKRIEALDGIHVASVAAAYDHALALTRCGRVYSWGEGGRYSHELGHGEGSDESNDGDDDVYHSTVVGQETHYGGYFLPGLITALLGRRVRAIAAGRGVSCAVTDDDELYTWGRNDFGSLGHGDTDGRNLPTLVQALHGIHVVGVSMCGQHTLALADDGSVYAFGEGLGLCISLGNEVEDSEEDDEVAVALLPHKIPDLVCSVPRR